MKTFLMSLLIVGLFTIIAIQRWGGGGNGWNQLKRGWRWVKTNWLQPGSSTRDKIIKVAKSFGTSLLAIVVYFVILTALRSGFRPQMRAFMWTGEFWIIFWIILLSTWILVYSYGHKAWKNWAKVVTIVVLITLISVSRAFWKKDDFYKLKVQTYRAEEKVEMDKKKQEFLAKLDSSKPNPPANTTSQLVIQDPQLLELKSQIAQLKAKVDHQDDLPEEKTGMDDGIIIRTGGGTTSITPSLQDPYPAFTWDRDLFPTEDVNKVDDVTTVRLNSTTEWLEIPLSPYGNLVMGNLYQYQYIMDTYKLGPNGIRIPRTVPYYWQIDAGGKTYSGRTPIPDEPEAKPGSKPGAKPGWLRMSDVKGGTRLRIRLCNESDVVKITDDMTPEEKEKAEKKITRVYWFFQNVGLRS